MTRTDERINIGGLTAAAVLAALYNASRPQGMGFLQYQPGDMTEEQAVKLFDAGHAHTYFDYLAGRVMKVSIPHDVADDTTIDVWGYDRDNGQGAAAAVISVLRGTGTTSNALTSALHASGVEIAADITRQEMDRPNSVEQKPKAAVFTLGLADVADRLGPAVDKALDSIKDEG